jgi:hypothetical protein
MPNTQPLPRILHLYSLVLFFLLMGNIPNLSVLDKSAWDMISWHYANEQFNLELIFFDCYLEGHQKILNSTHAMLQSCKHLPKARLL